MVRRGDSSDLAVNKVLPVPLSVFGGGFCRVPEGAALTGRERSLSQQQSNTFCRIRENVIAVLVLQVKLLSFSKSYQYTKKTLASEI